MPIIQSSYWLDALALMAGILLPFAFAPFALYPLAVLAPALLLATWLHCRPGRALWRGLLFGAGLFGVGASWIFISIYTYGNAPIILALFITLAFVLFLALFIGIQGWALNYFFPANSLSKLLLAFPASWVLVEWIRSWIFTGFPLLFLGYSQIASPLRGFAPLFSVYGVSFATAITSAVLVSLCIAIPRRTKGGVILLLLLLWLTGYGLSNIRWTQPQGKPIAASLMQGNVPILMKWDVAQFQKTLLLYKTLTEQHWDSQLIVWPEAAVTLYDTKAQTHLEQLDKAAKQHQTALITGLPIFFNQRSYNGMITLGNGEGVYLKRHLVPFGEYIPLQRWFGRLLQFFDIPMSSFSSGAQRQPPFVANGIRLAPFICYEIAYPQEVLAEFPAAQLIVVVTEDGWFGRSWAAAQQLQIAQMRALETGRYLLSATNTGITAIINPQGEITARAPTFTATVLSGAVQAMAGRTPLMYGGTYPVLALMGMLLLIAWITARRKPRL